MCVVLQSAPSRRCRRGIQSDLFNWKWSVARNVIYLLEQLLIETVFNGDSRIHHATTHPFKETFVYRESIRKGRVVEHWAVWCSGKVGPSSCHHLSWRLPSSCQAAAAAIAAERAPSGATTPRHQGGGSRAPCLPGCCRQCAWSAAICKGAHRGRAARPTPGRLLVNF